MAAAPLTERVGNVVGVHFSEDEDVALFLPESGDVLLCALWQWQQLAEKSVPATALAQTLKGLGACLHQPVQP